MRECVLFWVSSYLLLIILPYSLEEETRCFSQDDGELVGGRTNTELSTERLWATSILCISMSNTSRENVASAHTEISTPA